MSPTRWWIQDSNPGHALLPVGQPGEPGYLLALLLAEQVALGKSLVTLGFCSPVFKQGLGTPQFPRPPAVSLRRYVSGWWDHPCGSQHWAQPTPRSLLRVVLVPVCSLPDVPGQRGRVPRGGGGAGRGLHAEAHPAGVRAGAAQDALHQLAGAHRGRHHGLLPAVWPQRGE